MQSDSAGADDPGMAATPEPATSDALVLDRGGVGHLWPPADAGDIADGSVLASAGDDAASVQTVTGGAAGVGGH